MDNKRASISVLIMVIMTLLLFVYILAAMNYDFAKVSGNFEVISNLNDVYAEQEGYESTLYFRLVEVSLDSYSTVLNENSLRIGKDSELNLNDLFKANVETNFKQVESKISENLTNLFKGVDSFVFDGRRISVGASSWKVEKDNSLIDNSKIYYSNSLNSSFDLKSVGLPTFDEIEKVYNECKAKFSDETVISNCFNVGLPAFNSAVKCVSVDSLGVQISNPLQVVETPNANLYVRKDCSAELTSRDNFYLNKKMSKIKLSLFLSSTPTK